MKYKTSPIVLIDDDEEELMIVEEVLKSFNLQNEIHLLRIPLKFWKQ